MSKHTTKVPLDASDLPLNIDHQAVETGQPVNQPPVNQLTTLVNQSTEIMGLPLEPLQQTTPLLTEEAFYPSRTNRRLKGIRLPAHKLAQWEMWCLLNDVSFQDAVERAMDELVQKPVNWLTTYRHDDHEDKKKDDVIICFEKLTGTKWKWERDDPARKEVAHYPHSLLKCGIAMSVYRLIPSKGKVGSFRYCLGAIHEAASANVGDPEKYLEYVLSSLARARPVK